MIPAFNGRVTLTSMGEVLVATSFRLEENQSAFALPAIAPSTPPRRLSKVEVTDIHSGYGHDGAHVLIMTARWSGIELRGQMQAGTGCSMAKGYPTQH